MDTILLFVAVILIGYIGLKILKRRGCNLNYHSERNLGLFIPPASADTKNKKINLSSSRKAGSKDEQTSLDPDSASTHYNQDNSNAELGEHGAAIADYDKAIGLNHISAADL